jgi:hypothetical protein
MSALSKALEVDDMSYSQNSPPKYLDPLPHMIDPLTRLEGYVAEEKEAGATLAGAYADEKV